MFGKLIGLVTLPIDLIRDTITLGGELTGGKSATIDKLEYISGQKEFKLEQDRKDLEALIKALREKD